MRLFEDRYEAGRALGEKLATLAGRADVVVLGLPRGGVPLAREVGRRLRAPLDVFVVRDARVGDRDLPAQRARALAVRAFDRVERLVRSRQSLGARCEKSSDANDFTGREAPISSSPGGRSSSSTTVSRPERR